MATAKAARRPATFQDFTKVLQHDYPQFKIRQGSVFSWSPARNELIYRRGTDDIAGMVSLLHELGHALLGHKRYTLDFELLQLEVAAWEEATRIAKQYGVIIDDNHIQDCLDSYRDWLYRRSICPQCSTKALQLDEGNQYRCHNCHKTWQVASSRFCRPYRRQST